jgi:hypothetical protein
MAEAGGDLLLGRRAGAAAGEVNYAVEIAARFKLACDPRRDSGQGVACA